MEQHAGFCRYTGQRLNTSGVTSALSGLMWSLFHGDGHVQYTMARSLLNEPEPFVLPKYALCRTLDSMGNATTSAADHPVGRVLIILASYRT